MFLFTRQVTDAQLQTTKLPSTLQAFHVQNMRYYTPTRRYISAKLYSMAKYARLIISADLENNTPSAVTALSKSCSVRSTLNSLSESDDQKRKDSNRTQNVGRLLLYVNVNTPHAEYVRNALANVFTGRAIVV